MTVDALYLGIDGGGTGCRARLVDHAGRILGEGSGDPAGLTLGVERARDAILQATRAAFAAAHLGAEALGATWAGIGIAGADASNNRARRLAGALPFRAATVRNDAEIACLGAHAGDGAILILGTGSHGLLIAGGRVQRVGGWGFMLSDSGSGAVLGHRALRCALLAHEQVIAGSPFTEQVMARFEHSAAAMLEWALQAIPRDWASFAPMLFAAAAAGDPVAGPLLREGVAEVVALLDRLVALGAARIALLGGLAASYRPLLPSRCAALLVEPAGDPLDGALRLARAAAAEPAP